MSLIEPGLGIVIGSSATLRPLFHNILEKTVTLFGIPEGLGSSFDSDEDRGDGVSEDGRVHESEMGAVGGQSVGVRVDSGVDLNGNKSLEMAGREKMGGVVRPELRMWGQTSVERKVEFMV